MKKAVVAIFNSPDNAQGAKDSLLAEGFDEEIVDIASGDKYPEEDDGDNAISRFFKNLFTDKRRQRKYTRVAGKNYVVTVYPTSDEDAKKAAAILDDCGAIDIDKHYEDEYANDPDYVDDTDDVVDSGRDIVDSNIDEVEDEVDEDAITDDDHIDDDIVEDADADRERKIPVMEEKINISKKKVTTGGVRVRSRIVESPVEEHLRLRHENITVTRKKVDRPATDEELESLKDFKNGD